MRYRVCLCRGWRCAPRTAGRLASGTCASPSEPMAPGPDLRYSPSMPDPDRRSLLIGMSATLALLGCGSAEPLQEAAAQPPAPPAPGKAGRLISAARAQIGVTTSWNGTYARLAFPGG